MLIWLYVNKNAEEDMSNVIEENPVEMNVKEHFRLG